MAKRSTTFGLTATKISRLLALSQEPESAAPSRKADQEKAQRLTDFLTHVPALTGDTLNALPTLLQQMCRKMPRLEGESFGTRLFADNTPLDQLEEIKSLAKGQVSDIQDEARAETAGIVYYAAIAAALVHHQEKITAFSYDELKDLLARFEAMTWLPAELTELFQQAQAVCSKQSGQ
jgi:hypothetical protein